jgi:hypothetical protein
MIPQSTEAALPTHRPAHRAMRQPLVVGAPGGASVVAVWAT